MSPNGITAFGQISGAWNRPPVPAARTSTKPPLRALRWGWLQAQERNSGGGGGVHIGEYKALYRFISEVVVDTQSGLVYLEPVQHPNTGRSNENSYVIYI